MQNNLRMTSISRIGISNYQMDFHGSRAIKNWELMVSDRQVTWSNLVCENTGEQRASYRNGKFEYSDIDWDLFEDVTQPTPVNEFSMTTGYTPEDIARAHSILTHLNSALERGEIRDQVEFMADTSLSSFIHASMTARLEACRKNGYSGWWNEKECSIETFNAE